ncbi:SinI family autotransporter-associated protein [Budvicia aquatica]|uniref:Intimin-like protein SinH n=1 Tax=Budvicia aquatica TaxID=82979 RepID=A0A2C6DT78_9GAMM|nr:SinI family autotransporter-associated protein [Budvicia aquatica]PHI32021.1 ornithine carbamoyltransferase [Budvicia aquatica]VFS53606.1 intimin-like protein SinH [Budvicia aquatica]
MTMNFRVKQVVLALALAGMTSGSVWAASTPTTSSVQGRIPVLSAPSNNATQAVDFSGTYATPGQLSTGDTVVMTYDYTDLDGDVDNSLTTVNWSYAPFGGGVDVPITATNAPAASSGGQGTSTITLPIGALGATAIKVTVQEFSATGDPISGSTITVTDTSLSTGPGGGGGGGTGVTPPGPVVVGGNIAGGIFLASASPSAGSGAVDYARASTNPLVGQTYVFRAWNDANNNGIWEASEAQVVPVSIQWKLDGSNATANGTSAVATLNNHSIAGATSDTYTIPVNSGSNSGAIPGDQGFSLKVDFN